MALLCKLEISNEESRENSFIKSCHYVIFAKNESVETSLIDPILIFKRIATKSILLNDNLVDSPAFNELDSLLQNNLKNEQEFKKSFIKNVCAFFLNSNTVLINFFNLFYFTHLRLKWLKITILL